MIDIHSHILYDIDDGSKSLEMSLEMLRIASKTGITDIIATPHVNRRGVVPAWADIVAKVAALQAEAHKAALSIRIYAGAEVELNYNTLKFINDGSRDYCLAGSRYLLCELTEQSEPEQVEKLLYEIMLRGLIPILAHPERYHRIMTHPERVLDWMRQGTLAQCNMGSFTGDFGDDAKKLAEALLRNHMVIFLGTDAHRVEFRNTDILEAEETIAGLDKHGENYWGQCCRHGEKLLQDKVLYPQLPEHWQREKKSLLARLFGK